MTRKIDLLRISSYYLLTLQLIMWVELNLWLNKLLEAKIILSAQNHANAALVRFY